MNEMRKLMETIEGINEGNLRDEQEKLLDIIEGIEDRTELDRVIADLIEALPKKQLMDMIAHWGPDDSEYNLKTDADFDWDDEPNDGIPW